MMFQDFMIEVDDSNYNELMDNQITVLQFFSDWKMNCLMTLPLVEDIAQEFRIKHPEICFGRINIDEFEEIAERHKIINVPTIVILRDGHQVDRMESSIQEDILRQKIDAICKVCLSV